jgi:hypothetical protein
LALTAAGTWAAIELTWPDGLADVIALLLVLVPLLVLALPQAAVASAVNKTTMPVTHEVRIG